MGILDTFKKAIGGKADTEADKAELEVPGSTPLPVDEKLSEPEPTPVVKPEEPPAEKGSYTVQSGDTLWSIAESAYGDGSKFSKISDANTDVLEHPDRVIPGQKLRIPKLED
jgi:nucleoid-associated protein YgaU